MAVKAEQITCSSMATPPVVSNQTCDFPRGDSHRILMTKAPWSCYLFIYLLKLVISVLLHSRLPDISIHNAAPQMNYLMIKTSNSSTPLIKVWLRSFLRTVQQGRFSRARLLVCSLNL